MDASGYRRLKLALEVAGRARVLATRQRALLIEALGKDEAEALIRGIEASERGYEEAVMKAQKMVSP